MAKNLIIVEFKEDVEYFFKRHLQLFGPDTEVLSLLPEASVALADRKITYHNTINYFTKESHEKCAVHVDRIIKNINKILAIEDESNITQTYNNTFSYFLRPYISYIIFNLEIIDSFIKWHGIDHIYACRYTGNDYSGYSLWSKERILGELVNVFTNKCKVEAHPLKIPQRLKPNEPILFIKSFMNFIRHQIELLKFKDKAKPSIMFFSLKYNLHKIVQNLKNYQCFNLVPEKSKFLVGKEVKKGYLIQDFHLSDFGQRRDKRFSNSFEETEKRIHQLHQQEKVLYYNNIDFSEIVFKKIRVGFFQDFDILRKKIASLKRILRQVSPAVVISPVSRELGFALGELSQSFKIPSILISHGSHVPVKNEYDFCEWQDHAKGLIDTDYQYHLLQTPWAERFVENMSYKRQYYKIRPIIFPTVERNNKVRKQLAMYPLSQGQKIIVHASTPKHRGANRFYIYESIDEYIENLKSLIEATQNMPDVLLVIRFRPIAYLSVSELKNLLPNSGNYIVASEGNFSDYLEIADLLVSFSSTTIEEALINKVPVLQYDGTGRYMHLKGALWQRDGFESIDSVYCIDNRNILKDGLRWIMDYHLNQEVTADIFERHAYSKESVFPVENFIKDVVENKDLKKYEIIIDLCTQKNEVVNIRSFF